MSLEPQAGGARPQRAQGKRSERQSVRRLFPDTKTLSRLRPSQLQPRPEVASSQGQPWTMCTDGKIGAMSDHHESQPPLPAAMLRITLPLRGKHLNLGQDKPQEALKLQLALTPCPASPACLMLQPKKRCRPKPLGAAVKNSHMSGAHQSLGQRTPFCDWGPEMAPACNRKGAAQHARSHSAQ